MYLKIFKQVLATICLFVMFTAYANAAPVDRYISMIKNGVYTIKYEDITPQSNKTNRDKKNLSSRGFNTNDEYLDNYYNKTKTLVVSDGKNRYEEFGTEDYVLCKLQKGAEIFNFTKVKDKDKYVYIGSKKGEVFANKIGIVNQLQSGISFGNARMSLLLDPIIPNENKILGSLSYKKVASGNLPNGLSYADYSAVSDGNLFAIRYYFQVNNMVKIAGGLYYTDENGKINGERIIMKIDEFSESVDNSYLSLPNGLKDKTKR